MSLSTRTMNNGLKKVTHLVGCTLQSSLASFPGISSGGGYRQNHPQVSYAHFCGDAPIVPPERVIPVAPVTPIDTVDPVDPTPVVDPEPVVTPTRSEPT